MSRVALFGMVAFFAATLRAQQTDESFEVEPPLLIPNLTAESAETKSATPAPIVDLAKLEKDLARARKNAIGAERLYKIGALAKVEVESRALRVVRLESDLEYARLAQAKEEALAEKSADDSSPTPQTTASVVENDLAHAIQAAHAAAAKREKAEIEAAEMNLFRQQKLLALGSGSKASVRRAEQKLIELKTPKN